MAKKAVALFKTGGQNKNFVKVIRMVKSDKTGAYEFKEEMVNAEYVKDYLAKSNWYKNQSLKPSSGKEEAFCI